MTSPVLTDILVVMSRKSKVFERDFGKIDQSLGNIGGLYGLMIALFAFFMASYNQYRY